MKKILRLYRRWRYRRLYQELVLIYAKHEDYCVNAPHYAGKAFESITGFRYSEVRGG